MSLSKINILAIGTGVEQIDAIQYAKSKEFYVIAIDRVISDFVKEIVDEFYEIDLKNEDEIIHKIKDKNIKFIIPSTIGYLLKTIGSINDTLNLPGVTKEMALKMTVKSKYSEFLTTRSLFNPKKQVIEGDNKTANYIKKIIENVGLPCILKPEKGSGSRGVISIFKKNEIIDAIHYSLENLLSNEALIIEQYIEGVEYGVDFQIKQGDIQIIAIRDKIMSDLPYRQEVGYIYEFDDTKVELKKRISEELNRAFENEKNNLCCIGNIDVIINEKFVYFVEMSLRPAGLGIMYNFLPSAIGYNPVHNMINMLAFGEENVKKPTSNNLVGMFYLDVPPGKVKSLPNLGKFVVIKSEINLKIGDIVEPIKTGQDTIKRGYILLESTNRKQLFRNYKKILEEIEVEKM